MSIEVQTTMMASGIGAFVLGLIIGRWPSWSVKRRIGMLVGGSGVLLIVALWWAATLFAVISDHNLTYNTLIYGAGQYIDDNNVQRFWARRKDGWNRPFIHTLKLVREPELDGERAGRMNELLTFEVRSAGPNGVNRDNDDMWIQYEVQTRDGQVRLLARRWGGIGDLSPEDRIVPRDWTDPTSTSPEIAPDTE